MSLFFKKWRKENLSKRKIGNYLLYALGEIVLITIGILIAVKINEIQASKEHTHLRCHYLKELNYTFDYDIKDVEENISAFEMWNPKIKKVITAIQNKDLNKLDSVYDKVNTISEYIFFIQRSKTKIEELKYSNVDLINNRSLKNKILWYQDNEITILREKERKYNLMDEERRQYFSKTLYSGNVSVEQLEKDKQLFSIARQKYDLNEGLKKIYQRIVKEQYEIKKLIEIELEKNCG